MATPRIYGKMSEDDEVLPFYIWKGDLHCQFTIPLTLNWNHKESNV